MKLKITASDLLQLSYSEIANLSQAIEVTYKGTPVAVLLSYNEYQHLTHLAQQAALGSKP